MNASRRRRIARFVATVVAVALVVTGCTRDDDPVVTPTSVVDGPAHPRGGSVRVGVWSEPDPALDTMAGRAVRSLTRPSLFVVQPDGSWSPSAVEDGSVDAAGPSPTSVRFRLRGDARWSDGRVIDVGDLRRTADARFVAGVDGPDAAGVITVRFTHPLAGWQRLWSGAEAIAAPADDVHGGPFVVGSHDPGFETVLTPNEAWWGQGPFLDELRLVLVPDATTARELLAAGELDVLQPLPDTAGRGKVSSIGGVTILDAPTSGWSVALEVNGDRLRREHRRALTAAVPVESFVTTLLAGEADPMSSFGSGATWATPVDGDPAALRARALTVVTGLDAMPMLGLAERALQRAARDAGATVDLRNGDSVEVARWVGERDFDAAVVLDVDGPALCWTCRFDGVVDAGLLAAADGGAAAAVEAVERVLRDEALVQPWWRPRVWVAVRAGVEGVVANGFVPSPAWNAWQWWRS